MYVGWDLSLIGETICLIYLIEKVNTVCQKTAEIENRTKDQARQ